MAYDNSFFDTALGQELVRDTLPEMLSTMKSLAEEVGKLRIEIADLREELDRQPEKSNVKGRDK
jgi:regulator of replication initiation timing